MSSHAQIWVGLKSIKSDLVNIRYYRTQLPGIKFEICDILIVSAEKVCKEDQGFLRVHFRKLHSDSMDISLEGVGRVGIGLG